MEIHLIRATKRWETPEVRHICGLDDLLAIMRETGEALILEREGPPEAEVLIVTIYDGFVE